MNLSDSIIPRSDQANAEDFLSGPRTFTIEKVVAGTAEQPVEIHLVEMPGRPYKPSKSMRRVLVVSWGPEASNYTGRRLTLFRNPEITFGRDKVGGIEISHLSDIDGPVSVALTVTRGRRKNFTVAVLPNVAPLAAAPTLPAEAIADWVASFKDAADITALAGLWKEAVAQNVATHPEILAAKDARKAELT